MKTNSVRAAFACAVLAFTCTAAMATNKPIPGIDVIVKKNPGGNAITATTDAGGQIILKDLAPGDYEINIDGPSFVAAMDKIAPPAPEKSSGLSVGIGGMFGGSSHSSSAHQGAGPAGPSHGSSSSSGGGVGVGVSVPLGGGDSGSGVGPAPMVTFTATVTPSSPGGSAPTGTVSFLSETPYCRDVAGQGMRIGFTVPAGPEAIKNSWKGGTQSSVPAPAESDVFYGEPRNIGLTVGARF
jgi:hypothetical protein